MNVAAILREIDLEIEKLHRIRLILRSLMDPAPRKLSKPRIKAKEQPLMQSSAVVILPEPNITVLPARVKREYTPRVRPALKGTSGNHSKSTGFRTALDNFFESYRARVS